jgi:HSP20 family protein
MATALAPEKVPPRTEVARPARELPAPFDLMRQWTHEMDQFFNDFFGRRSLLPRFWRAAEEAAWLPAIELKDKEGVFTVRAELPGLAREDVKVEVLDGVLTISGERKQEKEEKTGGYYVTERRYGEFCRTIPLPEGALEKETQAIFKDGVLEVKVPHPAVAPRTPIEVSVT